MEKLLKKYIKCELIAILLKLSENKKTYDRIKSILRMDLDEI